MSRDDVVIQTAMAEIVGQILSNYAMHVVQNVYLCVSVYNIVLVWAVSLIIKQPVTRFSGNKYDCIIIKFVIDYYEYNNNLIIH